MKKLLFICAMVIVSAAALAQDSTKTIYLGKYKFPAGSVVTEVDVTLVDGNLTMVSTAGTSSLELIKGDTFTVVSFQGIAVFKRDSTGKKITGVHIDAAGYVLDGEKETVGQNTISVRADIERLFCSPVLMSFKRQVSVFSSDSPIITT
ncbi:MAG: hypothetical protein H7Y27_13290 [Gemmatimonadaceae bacterium]|nr:hypothetical protein [Chitinophagaceae bacterium]